MISQKLPPLHYSWIQAPLTLPKHILLLLLPLSVLPLSICAEEYYGRCQSKTQTIRALPLQEPRGQGEKKSSLQSQAGLCIATTEFEPFTPRVRNSFVLAQTVLFRKAHTGFEDSVRESATSVGHLSFSLKHVPLHLAGLNSHSPAIVLPSSAGQKVLIFPFFSL